MLTRRECEQREDCADHLALGERLSLAAREGPTELGRARYRQEFQSYLQCMDPTDVNDVLRQYETSPGAMTIRFRLSARSPAHENPDTTA